MKQIYFFLAIFSCCTVGLSAQSNWLAPETGYKTSDIVLDKAFSCHDIQNDTLYAIDSDGLYAYNLNTLEQIQDFGKAPAEYTGAWVSFVTADPDGKHIWVGYTTSGLTDDRIYSVDIETKAWTHVATLPGNFDMEIYDGNHYVSGLNKEGWDGAQDINCISLLDTSGNNQHKKLIEIGGNSSGFAIDLNGNIYNAKYSGTETETSLYQWTADSVNLVLSATDGSFLTVASGNVISTMPNNGPFDCDTDDAGNLLFNCNDFSSGSFLALWDGNTGDGHNYNKIATYGGSSFAWFAMLKAAGDITKDGAAYLINFGDPLAKIQRNNPPQAVLPLGPISAFEDSQNLTLDLTTYFKAPDNNEPITFEILSNSFDSVALAGIVDDTLLTIEFFAAGQTNIYIKATSNQQPVTEKIVVGVYPRIEGDYLVSGFDSLVLEPDSYWDGSDGSGGFTSAAVEFGNMKSEWSWEGWTYSNILDNTTAGYENQFSAITGAGFDSGATNMNYGVGYISSDWSTFQPKPLPLTFSDNDSHVVKGLYITNSTYAAMSMEYGDDFTKKFGGEDGNDPDYFKIFAWGMKDGMATDSVEYYLADYRFEDNSKDYIVKTWQWLDLSSLGLIDTLFFSMASSDVGDYGINTPSYFNIDNIYVVPNTTGAATVNNSLSIKVYPNPTSDKLWIESSAADELNVRIYNLSGSLVYNNPNYFSRKAIDLSEFSDGTYILKIGTLLENNVVKIIKR